MKWTIDVALRNREESERYWNEPLGLDTRLQRIFVMCIAILAIPIELVAELSFEIRIIAAMGNQPYQEEANPNRRR